MKKNYSYGDGEVPGEEVDFEPERERFNVYLLEDGTKIKLKTVVTSVARLDTFDKDGDPIYLLQSSNVMVTDSPPQLKKEDK
jgi:hypothetical protein